MDSLPVGGYESNPKDLAFCSGQGGGVEKFLDYFEVDYFDADVPVETSGDQACE